MNAESQVSGLKRKVKCKELDINSGEPCKSGSRSFTNSKGNKGERHRLFNAQLVLCLSLWMKLRSRRGQLWRAAGAKERARKGLFKIA